MTLKHLALPLTALALAAPSAAHAQADREITAGTGPTFTFEGAAQFGTNVTTELGPPECVAPPLTCDTTLIKLEQPGLYTFTTDVPDTSDIDTVLYESDASGAKGKLLKEGTGFIGDDETFAYDAEPGYVLFVGAYYFSLGAGFTVNGTFEPATPAAPSEGTGTPAAPAANRTPEAAIAKLAKAARRTSLKSFGGTASDADGKVAAVEIGLVQRGSGGKCKQLRSSGNFGQTGKCTPSTFLKAKGTSKWSFKLRKRLPKGKYVLYARAIDDKGAVQGGFSPASKKSFTVR